MIITVTAFNQICREIVPIIGVKGYVIASTEEQGKKKLKDKEGVRLVAVYPEYALAGEQDAAKTEHQLLFFTVVRESEGQSDEKELKQYQNTQDAIIKLKEYLLGEESSDLTCKLFPNAEITSVEIEPEYNIFGGYLGWSLKIQL